MTSLQKAEVPLRARLKNDGTIHLRWTQVKNSKILFDLKLLKAWAFLSKWDHEKTSLILWGENVFYKIKMNKIIKSIISKLKLHKHTNKEKFQGN